MMAYNFQKFSIGDVVTETIVNQIELNIRDHIHGQAGVEGSIWMGDYQSTVVASGRQVFRRTNSGNILEFKDISDSEIVFSIGHNGRMTQGKLPRGLVLRGEYVAPNLPTTSISNVFTTINTFSIGELSSGDIIIINAQAFMHRFGAGELPNIIDVDYNTGNASRQLVVRARERLHDVPGADQIHSISGVFHVAWPGSMSLRIAAQITGSSGQGWARASAHVYKAW